LNLSGDKDDKEYKRGKEQRHRERRKDGERGENRRSIYGRERRRTGVASEWEGEKGEVEIKTEGRGATQKCFRRWEKQRGEFTRMGGSKAIAVRVS
jgi:hypothetical protein